MSTFNRILVLAALAFCTWLICLLAPVLSPFLISAILAYMGDPVADRFEKYMPRTVAVSLTFLALVVILAGFGLLVVPKLADQFQILARLGPEAINRFESELIPWVQQHFSINLRSIDWKEVTSGIDWKKTGATVTKTLASVSDSGIKAVSFIGNLVLIPVVTFYLLRDWDLMVARLSKMIPRRFAPVVTHLAKGCHETLGAFLRGQLIVMLGLGVIYSAGLTMVGLNLALLIGLIAGIANIVPYMGFVVGISMALLAALLQFHDWVPLLWVLGVFTVGQMIEGTLLTPLLVGDKIGLHPVAVIFAVMAGGQLFGFLGILLGLPAAAVLMVLLRYAYSRYLETDLYRREPDEEPEENAGNVE